MHRDLHGAARALRDDRERHHRQPAAILLGAIAALSRLLALRVLPAAFAALALGGCGLFIGTPAPEGSDALISVLVTGDVPDDDLSLEIGGAAWSVAGGAAGSAGLSAPEPQLVRLIRVADCEELATVEADPGSAHAFVFAADGAVSVEDRRSDQDAGSPLEPRERTGCA